MGSRELACPKAKGQTKLKRKRKSEQKEDRTKKKPKINLLENKKYKNSEKSKKDQKQ